MLARRLRSFRFLALSCATAAVALPLACGSSADDSKFVDDGRTDGSSTTPPINTFPPGDPDGGGSSFSDAGGPVTLTLRDFRVYDASDSLTVADFENPPFGIGPDGGSKPGYQGDWDDRAIVSETLGADGKPVYRKGAAGTTLTTHGNVAFDKWFRDVPGTNLRFDTPLQTTVLADGSSEYDSNKSGQPNDPNKPDGSRGFFPLDDGTPLQTAFGNQGRAHNFSFTGEIHTEFTFKGGEYFSFRGDDDVWVYIDRRLVIDLGGIHSPEPASVQLDTLGLVVGQTYPLDFFFAERHVSQSNVLFQTTIALRPAPVR